MYTPLAAASSVTVTTEEVYPAAVEVKVAEPVPAASAVSVTVCAVAQLAGVKVRLAPPVTERPVLPAVRAVVTVTFAVGCEESFSAKVPVLPCATETLVGTAEMAGPAATVMPAGVDSPVAPVLSYAFAYTEWLPAPAPVQA